MTKTTRAHVDQESNKRFFSSVTILMKCETTSASTLKVFLARRQSAPGVPTRQFSRKTGMRVACSRKRFNSDGKTIWCGVVSVMWFGVVSVKWLGVVNVMWLGVVWVIWCGVFCVIWCGVFCVRFYSVVCCGLCSVVWVVWFVWCDLCGEVCVIGCDVV